MDFLFFCNFSWSIIIRSVIHLKLSRISLCKNTFFENDDVQRNFQVFCRRKRNSFTKNFEFQAQGKEQYTWNISNRKGCRIKYHEIYKKISYHFRSARQVQYKIEICTHQAIRTRRTRRTGLKTWRKIVPKNKINKNKHWKKSPLTPLPRLRTSVAKYKYWNHEIFSASSSPPIFWFTRRNLPWWCVCIKNMAQLEAFIYRYF